MNKILYHFRGARVTKFREKIFVLESIAFPYENIKTLKSRSCKMAAKTKMISSRETKEYFTSSKRQIIYDKKQKGPTKEI